MLCIIERGRPRLNTLRCPSELNGARRGRLDFTAPVKWPAFAGFNGVKIILLLCQLPDEADSNQSACG